MSKNLVIVGAGLAGLAAAIETALFGNNAVLVSSESSERAQSVMAEGGINAALNTKGENDMPEEHEKDTLKAACGIADVQAVHGLTSNAPDIVRQLHSWGVQFNLNENGEIDLRNFGGQKKKRTAFAQSDTGKQIMTALIDETRKYEYTGAIKRLAHHNFVTLLMDGDICGGRVVKDRYSGEISEITSDGVIIATGGFHGLFGDTTGSLYNTGEAVYELFRLGVVMQNCEMIQYHPTTVRSNGKRMLISEAARGEGGRLVAINGNEKRYFMEEKYPELKNLMPRDVTAREIYKELKNNEVFLDMRDIPHNVFSKKLSGLHQDCITYLNIDPQYELIPVLPGIHYFMGGIKVDVCHRTNIINLYAAVKGPRHTNPNNLITKT